MHTACDLDPRIITRQRSEFPNVRYSTSFDEVLGNSDIVAVAIATPAATHYELVKRSLLAGKDVFVEKPLSLTVKEGEELVRLAEKEKKGFNGRPCSTVPPICYQTQRTYINR